jgi:hypothetical protein
MCSHDESVSLWDASQLETRSGYGLTRRHNSGFLRQCRKRAIFWTKLTAHDDILCLPGAHPQFRLGCEEKWLRTAQRREALSCVSLGASGPRALRV